LGVICQPDDHVLSQPAFPNAEHAREDHPSKKRKLGLDSPCHVLDADIKSHSHIADNDEIFERLARIEIAVDRGFGQLDEKVTALEEKMNLLISECHSDD
jgi:hypothetical protein